MPNKPDRDSGTGGHPRNSPTTPIPTGDPSTYATRQQVLNPPFDPRMRKIGSPVVNPKPMKRGWIETAMLEGIKQNYRVNFLFNPSEISLSHSIDTSLPNPEQTYAAGKDNVVPGMTASLAALGASLSFSLLFDRTYEVWSRNNKSMANVFGCYADVGAFYKFLRIISKMPTIEGPSHISTPGDPDTDAANQFREWEFLSPTSPPFMIPAYIWIGAHMKYYGYINSINVTYTHWSHAMVPIRCRVDLGFTLLMDPAEAEALAAGGDGSTTSNANTPHSVFKPPFRDTTGGNH